MNDDLISRSAFLKRMMRTARYFYVKFDIMEEPAVDAVEVVRCKDCNHVLTCNCLSCRQGVSVYCGKYGKHMKTDDFCSRGERRDD